MDGPAGRDADLAVIPRRDVDPSGERRGGAELPVIATVAGVVFVAVVAGIDGSPLQPVLPPGAEPLAPFRFAARIAGLDALGPTAQATVAILAMGAAAATFLYALRAAWRGDLSVRLVVWVGVAFVGLATVLPLLF